MSKIALAPSASGTGTLTISAPNTNSDASITLPTITGGEFIVSNASGNVGIGTASPSNPLTVQKANGGDFVALFQNTTSATPYGVFIKDAASSANGYPLLQVTNSAGSVAYLRVDSGTGNVLINNGYGSAAVAYGCRAWVNFNGTGTVAIRASGNVSSITDNGTGDYTLNFTTALPDANYSAVFGGGRTSGGAVNLTERHGANIRTTTQLRIYTLGENWSTVDPDFVSVEITR